MNRLTLLGGILLLTSSSLSAETLNLTAGTMTSGGDLSVRYRADAVGTYNAGGWTGGANFNFGYFVIDNLALTFDVGGAGKLTTATDPTRMFSLGINLMYAIDTGTMVRPYGQIGGFGAWSNPTNGVIWLAGVKPAIGLLVGLNEYVALDFGVQAKISFPVSPSTGNTSLDGGVGYFGVRAFF